MEQARTHTGEGDSEGPARRSVWLVDAPVERLELGRGAWVDVVRGLVPEADAVHDALLEQVPWRQGRVYRYERWLPEPRLGGFQKGRDRHPALVEVEAWLSRRYRVRFDGLVAMARYRDGSDGQGLHRDREMCWLEDTVIGVLTLGAQRPWFIKPLGSGRSGAEDDMYEGSGDVLDLRPAGGDLIVMGGRCQAAFLHGVPKVRDRAVGDRISAQWRWTSRRGRPDTSPGYYEARHFSR